MASKLDTLSVRDMLEALIAAMPEAQGIDAGGTAGPRWRPRRT